DANAKTAFTGAIFSRDQKLQLFERPGATENRLYKAPMIRAALKILAGDDQFTLGVNMSEKHYKYDPLKRWLQQQQLRQVELTFDEIADLVGGLPLSAEKRAAWWANETDAHHSQCKAWLEAGYLVHADRAARKVSFSRASDRRVR
ncbi:hypothetical protein H8B02_45435, partial [Bradyrhizobium sp. Pear77]|uniref:DUF7662 domain-containing protein n=1 Tax=Bradyrhizobium altum TaxID=1571202 RepID=UPI001E51C64E